MYNVSSNVSSSNNPNFVPNPDSLEYVFQSVILAVVCPFNAISNIATFLVIIRSEKLREHSGNFFVASLALLDGVPISIVIAFRLAFIHDFYGAVKVCAFSATLLVTTIYCIILHLMLLSCDRFIFMFFPLRYSSIVTPTRSLIALVPAWLLPFFSMTVIPQFNSDIKKGSTFRNSLVGCPVSWNTQDSSPALYAHHLFNTVWFLAVPFAVMLVVHALVAKLSFKQANKVYPGSHLSRASPNFTSAVLSVKRRIKALKWAKTIAIMICSFLLTYLPAFTCSLVAAHRGTSLLPRQAKNILLLLVFLNSPLNFIIYSLRSKVFTGELEKSLSALLWCLPEHHRMTMFSRRDDREFRSSFERPKRGTICLAQTSTTLMRSDEATYISSLQTPREVGRRYSNIF
ncbi:adenosine receptor A1 [Nematostella vectensis]|uniref:adenosine receptor A1 n=1 Tax=Nematostella vectensis TaxID=45351 RepID=UPI0020773A08|nr:adenosine receptor A1 [Nematostella vectensis]